MRRWIAINAGMLIFVLALVQVNAQPAPDKVLELTVPKSKDGTDGFYVSIRNVKRVISIDMAEVKNGNVEWKRWAAFCATPNAGIEWEIRKTLKNEKFFGYNSLAPGTRCDTSMGEWHTDKTVKISVKSQKLYIDEKGTHVFISGTIVVEAGEIYLAPSMKAK